VLGVLFLAAGKSDVVSLLRRHLELLAVDLQSFDKAHHPAVSASFFA
jgi:hypothetical protein